MQYEKLLCPIAEFLGQQIELFPFVPDSDIIRVCNNYLLKNQELLFQ